MQLDEINKMIAELEDEEKKILQKVERNKKEQRRLEYRIKMSQRDEEKNRVHKMIVFGTTVWNEFNKAVTMTDEEYYELMHRSDDDWKAFGKGIAKGWYENAKSKK